MWQENDKILLRLKQMQDVVLYLKDVAPYPENYFDVLTHAQFKNSNSSLELMEQLETLEAEVSQLILTHLQQLSTAYNISGHLKLSNIHIEKAVFPAAQLLQTIKDFEEEIQNNKQYLVDFNLEPKTHLSLKSSKRIQNKRERAVIPELPLTESTQEEWLEIETLLNQLLEIEQKGHVFSLSKLELDSSDYVLKSLCKKLDDNCEEGGKLVSLLSKRVYSCQNASGYYADLRNKLAEAIKEIQQINDVKEQLYLAILTRRDIICPSSDDPITLNNHFKQAQHCLSQALEKFMSTFSTIILSDRSSVESIYLKKQLLHCTEEMIKELQAKQFPVNPAAVKNLRIKLLNHLGEKTGILDFKASVQPLTETIIQGCLIALFDAQPSHDAVLLKKQIAAFYHAAAKVADFPLDKIKMHDTLSEVLKTQEKEIENDLQHHSKAVKDQIEALTREINLFSLIYPEPLVVTEAKEVRSKLLAYQKKLQQLSDCYQTSHKENRARLQSLSDSLRTRKNSSLDFEIISKLIEVLESVTSQQQNILNAVQEIKTELNRIPGADSVQRLIGEYNTRKQDICTSLKIAIDHAEAAVKVRERVLESPRTPGEEGLLQAQRETLFSIMEEPNLSLNSLGFRLIRSLSILDKLIDHSKKEIKLKFSGEVDDLLSVYTPMSTVVLNDLNPFKEDMIHQSKKAAEALRQLSLLQEELDSVSGGDLAEWLNCFEKTFRSAERWLISCRDTLQQGQVIETRLCSEAYKTSLVILGTLKAEFTRILGKFIKNHPNHDSLHLLNLNFSSLNDFSRVPAEVLKFIDPRLSILLSMHQVFNQVNQGYISREIRRYTDQLYLDHLRQNVEEHLHNDHMEDISNGKRHKFVQWIRVHVLKSLQALTYQVGSYFKHSDKTRHHFFVTPLACKTERELVTKGNEVYNALANISYLQV
ncbi:hypothetical protein [Legionella jordanis]|uniref:Uncharacterized protein n=1 Tax=Legionella jordanis TaxID=456 RepID=A0A0W0VE29_9GAMM|nr:hypothetical protein [Legionella jordanis]KTD18407.1 hypothetical protein Ljor_2713 [Legionella jordanis]RMX05313.1 hypothetical protein EAW55_01230 [Legionella jordanis]VEH13247.1 Uncharacterised protein [Legionella jordanis]